ncbi:hypothetical protein KSS87_006594 [Heliosperma pusillum]|nr:hypothetical protein KSS87_006594 [Heliosperma pusillum]
MHIKEVCLEGFKSYATRTVIPGFDPFFNAITGLNGSGKSNILDSICFVLGITNLQQVRASNLQELVYKQGQAGITKATVSIIFDNSDRNRSPLGYEDSPEITVTRQGSMVHLLRKYNDFHGIELVEIGDAFEFHWLIKLTLWRLLSIVVGGRNKYLINGHLAQPSRVQNLFHSVQLNVNNPHFLIMQGRITKVLNMKPPEILSMLEEAAGTRMYETKKESALKTLEKKQSKVDEIDKLLDQEILPALEKLRKERTQYSQWANGNVELDRLKRFCIAYEYVQAEKIKDSAVHEVEQVKAKITEVDTNAHKMKAELQEMDTKVSELTAEKEASMGGEIKTLQQKVDALANELVKETSVLRNKEDTISTEKKNADKIKKNIEELKQSVEERAAAVKKAEDGAADLRRRAQELSKDLDDSEKEYQGVLAGKNSQNDEKCMEDQLADAKAAVGNVEIELKQLKTQISHNEKELKEKNAQFMSKRDEATALEKELSTRKREVEDVTKALESLPYKEDQNQRMDALHQERGTELNEVQKLKDKIRGLNAQLANVEFTYRDPSRNFDRSKVKGVVAKLIKIKDGSTMTALEVVAGGRLFNVVVDTETTGKQLLQNGDLRRRVTIIPLNKIQAYVISPHKEQAATKLSAMEYVFGSTFVCKTREAAVKVAFNKEGNVDVREPCVTLEGDIFQPSGLLTGGSRRGGGELLGRLCALAEAESDLNAHLKRLSEIEAEIGQLLPLQKNFTELNNQLKLKEYEFELFKGRAEQNEHHKLGELLKKIEQDLSGARSSLKAKQEDHQKFVKKMAALGKSIKELDSSRESRLKDLEKRIKVLKAQMQSASKDLKGHENQREKLIMEVDAVAEECASLESQLDSLVTQIQSLVSEVDEQKIKVASIKKNHDQTESDLNSARLKLKECDSQISHILKEQQKLQSKISDATLERKKMENEVRRMEEEQKDCSLKVAKLIEKHAWIASEKQLFGRKGSDYDFSSRDPHEARVELERLQTEQSGYIAKFKAKFDFGSIFSTLLPGTTAKLEPPEGGTFLDGLEVRVAFGGVWKQSLSELSGGQRSLLALSLILALLLFKPAPLYILDEVDAALDLSHTQNIGRMIKSHFPHSQFIVVSLKEGMFNNANVIFRTKFVDGVSTVQRTVTAKHK